MTNDNRQSLEASRKTLVALMQYAEGATCAARVANIAVSTFDLIRYNQGWTKTAIKTALREAGVKLRDADANAAIDLLIAEGRLRTEAGPNRSQHLYLAEQSS